MTLRSQMAADLALIHADPHGPAEAASYQPAAGGSAISTRLTLTRTGEGEEEMADGIWLVKTAQAYVLVAEVPTSVQGDTITLGSETWTVRDVFTANSAVRELRVMQQVRNRLSGGGAEHNRLQVAAPRRV